MYDKNLLITNALPPLGDPHILSVAAASVINVDINISYSDFIARASKWLLASKYRNITGIDTFTRKDIIMGCNHYIDNILICNGGVDGVQIFEHDYGYYKKLNPNIRYTTVDTLEAGRPLLIAMPFPGQLAIHREMNNILERCDELNIPVHLDGAWLPTAFDIEFDFNRKCIQSFATSFSKAVDLGWNRIGIRWSKSQDTDNIILFNESMMIPYATLGIADYFMQHETVDYFIDTYKEKYYDVCRKLMLRPSNIIHAAHTMNRQQLLGLKDLLTS